MRTDMRSPMMPEIVVVVTGAFDGAAVARWGRLITEAVDARPGRLIVDLTDSPTIDAAAIVQLLQVHRQMVTADGQLVLRGPVARVRRMLSLARIDHVLEIEASAGEAGIASRARRSTPADA